MSLQTFDTSARPSANPAAALFAGLGRPLPSFESVRLRHLKGAQIDEVLHLRDGIDLSVHAAAGPSFLHLEKKETSAVLCLLSSSMAS